VRAAVRGAARRAARRVLAAGREGRRRPRVSVASRLPPGGVTAPPRRAPLRGCGRRAGRGGTGPCPASPRSAAGLRWVNALFPFLIPKMKVLSYRARQPRAAPCVSSAWRLSQTDRRCEAPRAEKRILPEASPRWAGGAVRGRR